MAVIPVGMVKELKSEERVRKRSACVVPWRAPKGDVTLFSNRFRAYVPERVAAAGAESPFRPSFPSFAFIARLFLFFFSLFFFFWLDSSTTSCNPAKTCPPSLPSPRPRRFKRLRPNRPFPSTRASLLLPAQACCSLSHSLHVPGTRKGNAFGPRSRAKGRKLT